LPTRVKLATRAAIRNLLPKLHQLSPISGVRTMKAILLAVALIAGLATVAAIVAPHVAYACEPSDPGCGG